MQRYCPIHVAGSADTHEYLGSATRICGRCSGASVVRHAEPPTRLGRVIHSMVIETARDLTVGDDSSRPKAERLLNR